MSIDSELKKIETSTVTTNTLIRFAEYKGLDVEGLIKVTGLPLSHLTDTSNWVSHDIAKKMYRKLNEMLGDPEGTYKAGMFSHKLRTLGLIEILARLFAGPDIVYRKCGEFSKRFNRVYEMKLLENGKRHAIIKVKYFPEFEATKEGCDYTKGILTMVPTGWNLPPARVQEKQCQVDGADSCIYEINFDRNSFFKNLWYQTLGRAKVIREALEESERNLEESRRNLENLEEIVQERTKEIIALQEMLLAKERQETARNILAGRAHEFKNTLSVATTAAQAIDQIYLPKAYDLVRQMIKIILAQEGKKIPKSFVEQNLLALLSDYIKVVGDPTTDRTDMGRSAKSIKDAVLLILDQHAKANKLLQKQSNVVAAEINRGYDVVDVAKVVSSVQNKFYPQIKEYKIEVDFKPRSAIVVGNKEHYREIFHNLFSNSIYALQKQYKENPHKPRKIIISMKGEVKKEDKEFKRYIRFLFFDTGIGMTDKEKKGEVFKESYTTRTGEEGQELGLGLGMGIMKNYCALYGGNLRIISSKIGYGTNIELILPTQLKEK